MIWAERERIAAHRPPSYSARASAPLCPTVIAMASQEWIASRR